MAWSGLYNNVPDIDNNGVDGHMILDADHIEQKISKLLRRNGARRLNVLMTRLNGTVAGAQAVGVYRRVGHTVAPGEPGRNGGRRDVDTITTISRATTVADKDAINDIIGEQFAPTLSQLVDPYPVDASGNGGGGKLANRA